MTTDQDALTKTILNVRNSIGLMMQDDARNQYGNHASAIKVLEDFIARALEEPEKTDEAPVKNEPKRPSWEHRSTQSLDGWMNELALLCQHPKLPKNWLGAAINTIYNGLNFFIGSTEHVAEVRSVSYGGPSQAAAVIVINSASSEYWDLPVRELDKLYLRPDRISDYPIQLGLSLEKEQLHIVAVQLLPKDVRRLVAITAVKLDDLKGDHVIKMRSVKPITRERILEISEKFGCFEYGDAQGHKRVDFARAVEHEHNIGE